MYAIGLASLGTQCQNIAIGMASLGVFCDGVVQTDHISFYNVLNFDLVTNNFSVEFSELYFRSKDALSLRFDAITNTYMSENSYNKYQIDIPVIKYSVSYSFNAARNIAVTNIIND
jgi:hypothetical protein